MYGDDYANGDTLFGIDLTLGPTGLRPSTLVKRGNLSVSVIFNSALGKVCMMIYDLILEITQHR